MVTDVLFSQTVLLGVVLVIGVFGASYAGTTMALTRFFDEGGSSRHERR